MASSSAGLPPMPDFNSPSSQPPAGTVSGMKSHLQSLLDTKERQLQEAGALGQKILAQRVELEDRIKQLQDVDAEQSDEEIDGETKGKYQELTDAVAAWDVENAKSSQVWFGSKTSSGNGIPQMPSSRTSIVSRDEHERARTAGASAASQSRRAKNAAHRANDVEFAFEIGSGLLTEVRRLQSLLGERDKALQDMKEEKDDLDKTVEGLKTALRQQEQNSDKFKEENWNLEVTLQELRVQLSDAQASNLRLEGEHKRLTKLLAASRETIDNHKTENERLTAQVEEFKTKHEADVANARKTAAVFQREKSELQAMIDSLKLEVTRASRRLPRHGLSSDGRPEMDSLAAGFGADEDVFGSGALSKSTNSRRHMNADMVAADEYGLLNESPDPSPSKSFSVSKYPRNEVEALQQRLAHANRQINTLRGALQKKAMSMSVAASPRASLDEDRAAAANHEVDGDEDSESPRKTKTPRRGTPFRRGAGRGRGGRGGLSLAQRLGMASRRTNAAAAIEFDTADDDDEDDENPFDTSVPPVPPVPIRLQAQTTDADSDKDVFGEPTQLDDKEPTSPTSNRTSIDGMDPVFANVLKRSNSNGSIHHTGSHRNHHHQNHLSANQQNAAAAGSVSPFRQGITVGRAGTRRMRGGAPFVTRPSSMVGQPEALSVELLGMTDLHEDEEEEREVVVAKVLTEASCQTEGEVVVVRTGEGDKQAAMDDEEMVDVDENEHAREPLAPATRPVPETAEFGVQVDPEPVPVPEPVVAPTSETSSQTDAEPVVQHSDMGMQHDAPLPLALEVVTSEMSSQTDVQPDTAHSEMAIQHDGVPFVEATAAGAAAASILASSVYTDSVVGHSSRTSTPERSAKPLPGALVEDDDLNETPRRHTITRATLTYTPTTRADAALVGSPLAGNRAFLTHTGESDVDDGTETETGPETDAEEDEYTDARQSIRPTPSQSQVSLSDDVASDDFHSILTVTDNEGSGSGSEFDGDDDFDEGMDRMRYPSSLSHRASALAMRQRALSQTTAVGVPLTPPVPDVEHEDKGVYANLIPPAEPAPEPKVYESREVATDIVEEPETLKVSTVEVEVSAVPSVEYASVGILTDAPEEPEPEPEVHVISEPPAVEYASVGVSAELIKEPELQPEVDVAAVAVQASEPVPPAVEYDNKSISAEIIEPDVPAEPTPVPVAEPKPEVKEMSVQTDEWYPAPRLSSSSFSSSPDKTVRDIPMLAAPVASSPGFTRVGSASQQFHFVSAQSAGPSTSTFPIPAIPPNSSVRDSTGIIRAHTPRSSAADRRQSIESVVTSAYDDPSRMRAISTGALSALSVDKTKPPMMVLPPPPRQPPPSAAMPPPSFIPERRIPTTSTSSYDSPERPPRPTSPPPPELIQRATTPTFGSKLSVPGSRMGSLRYVGSSMSSTSNQQALSRLPSASSFVSSNNHAQYSSGGSVGVHSANGRERREMSTASLASDRSPRSSVSSDHHGAHHHNTQVTPTPTSIMHGVPTSNLSTPNRMPQGTPQRNTIGPGVGGPGGSTDPSIIHAITQTMIGEYLYKYTRKTIGKGYGQTRHKRFFWVHPYTKTLYWSSADPGSSNVQESSAKSAYIEGVRSVLDPNPMPPGLYQYSVVISTPQREMKITAPTKERHDIWLNALRYLLTRSGTMGVTSTPFNNIGVMQVPQSPLSMTSQLTDERDVTASPRSQRVGRHMDPSYNTTPKDRRSRSQMSLRGSIGKRSGTPAAEYLRWNSNSTAADSPYTPSKSFEHVTVDDDDDDLDFELHNDALSEGGYEGLENVRACCDGKHTVGGHHHHHHHHPIPGDHLEVTVPEPRPASPAWSFRSRAGSAGSHDFFSSKLRFGSRRSTKTVQPSHDS